MKISGLEHPHWCTLCRKMALAVLDHWQYMAIGCLLDVVEVVKLKSTTRQHFIGQVEVYDTTTFYLQYLLSVVGLGAQVFGLVTCDVNNCLYVSDWSNKSVHIVDMLTDNVVW